MTPFSISLSGTLAMEVEAFLISVPAHTEAGLFQKFRYQWIALLEGDFASASSIRKAGILRGLEVLNKKQTLKRIWITSTNADSQAPLHGLAHQAPFVQQGFDIVLGTVETHGGFPQEFAPNTLVHQ